MKLSILVCGLCSRLHYSWQLIEELQAQAQKYPGEVEVLTFLDTGLRSIGTKRNQLIGLAMGDYIVFVDDDDWIDEEYVKAVLTGCRTGADVVTIPVAVNFDGGPWKPCTYSINFEDEGEDMTHYWRWPNHICAMRTELVRRHPGPFPETSFGEDSVFARRMRPELRYEVAARKSPLRMLNVDEASTQALYFYQYDSTK